MWDVVGQEAEKVARGRSCRVCNYPHNQGRGGGDKTRFVPSYYSGCGMEDEFEENKTKEREGIIHS